MSIGLFKKNTKNPRDLMKVLLTNITIISEQNPGKRVDKAHDEVSKALTSMKQMLCGTEQQEPQTEVVAALAQEFSNENVIYIMSKNLAHMDFEGKKDWCQIFANLLRRQIGTRFPTIEMLNGQDGREIRDLVQLLVKGYTNSDIALCCGIMLRECIRHEPLARQILFMDEFYEYFHLVEMSTFDIASDAFSTFKDALTKNRPLSAEFLEKNYDKFFLHYTRLLESDNYVTRRQSLKLLGELLLDRHNFSIMTKYISRPENLKMMMNNLRDQSRNIQFEAFHVFKVFVANPNKTKPILDILLKNQQKLVDFLSNFLTERSEDDQFNDEKAYLIKQIKDLKP